MHQSALFGILLSLLTPRQVWSTIYPSLLTPVISSSSLLCFPPSQSLVPLAYQRFVVCADTEYLRRRVGAWSSTLPPGLKKEIRLKLEMMISWKLEGHRDYFYIKAQRNHLDLATTSKGEKSLIRP
ncbi:hypothetical protein BGW80DRAFT_1313828 [Lactifluus volemus]|nr:hypothetical protein BGW80DRAFT_1313828 [Lactifluus volemus]